MSKLNVRNATANTNVSEIIEGLEDYHQQNIELEAERLFEAMERLDEMEAEGPREYALGFYNFMLPCGMKVLNIYRKFDHVLLTHEQASECMTDVMYDLIDLYEGEGEVYFDLNDNNAMVHFPGDEDDITAYVWIARVDELTNHSVDVIDSDRYWVA